MQLKTTATAAKLNERKPAKKKEQNQEMKSTYHNVSYDRPDRDNKTKHPDQENGCFHSDSGHYCIISTK